MHDMLKPLGTREYVIAATPGWSLFIVNSKDDIFEEPIIGWLLTVHDQHPDVVKETGEPRSSVYPYPITAGDGLVHSDYCDGKWAIKTPNGTYELQGDCTFHSKEHCVAHFCRETEDA